MRLRFFAAEPAAQNDIEGRTLLNALPATLIQHPCLYIHRSNSVDNRVFTLLQTSSNSPTLGSDSPPEKSQFACASPGVVRLEKYPGDDELSVYCFCPHIV